MERFDANIHYATSDKKKFDKCLDFTMLARTSSCKKSSKSRKSPVGSCKRSSPHRRSANKSTVIEPYQKAASLHQTINLADYEKEKGKITVKDLSQTGMWKQIPDLVRNELWIRERKRKLKRSKRKYKKLETKECTFKPHINSKATLSPSPKYKYHDLRKNNPSSYSKQGRERKQVQDKDHFELYGKYVQKLGNYTHFTFDSLSFDS